VTNHQISSTSFERISFQIVHNKKKIKIIAYYRPPESQKIKNVDEFMNDVESEISEDCEKIMLVGDVNIDLSENQRYASEYKNLLNGYNMMRINDEITRDISGKIIDHVAVSFSDICHFNIHTISLDKNFSNHNMIVTTIEDMKVNEKKSEIRTFDFLDYDKLQENFNASLELNDIYKLHNVNEIAQKLTDITHNAINSSTKIVKLRKKNSKKIIPWFNKRIRKIQSLKNTIRKKLKKNRHCHKTRKRFKEISQKLKAVIQLEEKKFNFKNLMVKDPKILWRNLNSVLRNSYEIAESFNHQFIDSVNETVSSMSVPSQHFKFSSLSKSMGLEETNSDEIINAIQSLKNVSPGIDNIKPQVIKFLKNEIAEPLCYLINNMFQSGIYPDIFKTAIVIPINKTGKKNDIQDYRPVSILSSFNKVVEKILYKRIMNFVQKNELLYIKQFGFREKSNTETAVIELINDIRQHIDKKKKVSLVFMDVSKAFDTVNTQQLLESLERSGIRGVTLNLIGSYLSNRKQQVKIGNVISTTRDVMSGVVQGGTLGSLLFIIFLNEISQLKLSGTLYIYADDVLLLNSHNINEEINDIISKDVSKIIDFFKFKRLLINKAKTTYMIIHSPYQNIHDGDEILIENHFSMKRTKYAKYLGLVIDENLNFEEHCKSLESKLASSAGMIWRLKKKLPTYIN